MLRRLLHAARQRWGIRLQPTACWRLREATTAAPTAPPAARAGASVSPSTGDGDQCCGRTTEHCSDDATIPATVTNSWNAVRRPRRSIRSFGGTLARTPPVRAHSGSSTRAAERCGGRRRSPRAQIAAPNRKSPRSRTPASAASRARTPRRPAQCRPRCRSARARRDRRSRWRGTYSPGRSSRRSWTSAPLVA